MSIRKDVIPTAHVPSGSTLAQRLWNHRTHLLFLLPALVFTAIFHYRPYLWVIMAFEDFTFAKGLWASRFVGLFHFREFLTSPDFYRVLRNTLAINGFAFLFGFPAPILLALLINELRSVPFKKTVQTVTYLPHFISWVVVAGLAYRMLDRDTGSVNLLLAWLGAPRVPFMREEGWFWPVITFLSVWKEAGWYSIIYLAALSAIDPQLYDAAMVDGATRRQRLIYITLPGIATTIAAMLVLTSGRLATGGGVIPAFEALFNMNNPLVNQTGETISLHVYREGIWFSRYSYATAIGLSQSAVALLFVGVANSLAKRFRGYGIF
jgi:putative aldouronate transport system permease protein